MHTVCLVPHYTAKDTLDWADPVLKVFLRENHIIGFFYFFKDMYWCIGAGFKTTKANLLVGSHNNIDACSWFVIPVKNVIDDSRMLYVKHFRD